MLVAPTAVAVADNNCHAIDFMFNINPSFWHQEYSMHSCSDNTSEFLMSQLMLIK